MLNIIDFYSGGIGGNLGGGNLGGGNLGGDTREEGKGGRGQKKENEKMFFYPSLWLRQIFINRFSEIKRSRIYLFKL